MLLAICIILRSELASVLRGPPYSGQLLALIGNHILVKIRVLLPNAVHSDPVGQLNLSLPLPPNKSHLEPKYLLSY